MGSNRNLVPRTCRGSTIVLATASILPAGFAAGNAAFPPGVLPFKITCSDLVGASASASPPARASFVKSAAQLPNRHQAHPQVYTTSTGGPLGQAAHIMDGQAAQAGCTPQDVLTPDLWILVWQWLPEESDQHSFAATCRCARRSCRSAATSRGGHGTLLSQAILSSPCFVRGWCGSACKSPTAWFAALMLAPWQQGDAHPHGTAARHRRPPHAANRGTLPATCMRRPHCGL